MKPYLFSLIFCLTVASPTLVAAEHLAVIEGQQRASDPRQAPDWTDLKVRMKMAAMYINGVGVEKDISRAIAIYESAAAEEVAFAQYRLARIYLDGKLLPPDPEKAFQWLLHAARLGFVDAQLELSRVYAEGLGVARNDVEAHKWLSLAASLGVEGIDERQAEIEARMSFTDKLHARYLANKCKLNRYEGC